MRQLLGMILMCFFLVGTACSQKDDCGKFRSDRCSVNEKNFRKITDKMSKKDVLSIIGLPYSELPDYANSFGINHCVWQRYDYVERGVVKNISIVVDFKNDSIVFKSIEEY